MALANVPHTAHLVFRGQTQNVQSWSFGMWFTYQAAGGGTGVPSAETVLGDMLLNPTRVTAYGTFITALCANLATNQGTTAVSVSVYGEDPTTPAVGELPSVHIGTGGPMVTPPEVAVVASLRTAAAGRSGRGRSYLPLNALSVQDTGQLSSAAAAGIASMVAAFLNSMNAVVTEDPITGGWQVTAAVVSRTHGAHHAVTQVLCDTRFDAQRRREDKLLGQVESASVS